MNVSKFMKFVDMTQSPQDKEMIKNAVHNYISFQKQFQKIESEAIIYRVSCKDQNIKDSYVGHTFKPLESRTYHHRKTCENKKYRYHNKKLYKCVRENGGWDNFHIDVIESGVMNKSDARTREQFWIEKYCPTLNKIDAKFS